MQRGSGWMMWAGRAAMVVVMAAAVSASVGCQQQQLEERNAALTKQFEEAMATNGVLSTENEQLKSDNQRLNSDLARLSTRTAAGTPPVTTPARTTARGPVPDFGPGTEVSMAGEAMTIRMTEAVLFAPGQAVLLPAAQKALDKIADHLKTKYAKAKTRVEGHTDNQPIVRPRPVVRQLGPLEQPRHGRRAVPRQQGRRSEADLFGRVRRLSPDRLERFGRRPGQESSRRNRGYPVIVIVDYGMGNLRSVQKALERIGHPALVTDKPEHVAAADRLVVPGVGAFGDAMTALRARHLVEPIREFCASGRPFLGICLGLQSSLTKVPRWQA